MEKSPESIHGIGPNLNSVNILELLDVSVHEPALDSVIEIAKTYDTILRFEPPENSYRLKMVKALDEKWKPWMNSYLKASGMVYIQTGNNLKPCIIAGTPALSNGFSTIIPPYEGESGEYSSRLAYYLYISGTHLTEDEEDDRMYPCHAIIDEAIVQTNRASRERAITWLELAAPQFVKEVDQRIVSSRDEVEALMALKGLDLSEYIDVNDELTRNSAETYLDSVIQLNQFVPYSISIRGFSFENNKMTRKKIARKDNFRGIAYFNSIHVHVGLTTEYRPKWEVALLATLASPEASQGSATRFIPIDSLSAPPHRIDYSHLAKD